MHGDDQMAKIAAGMANFGWTVPCMAADDGELIAGHGRVLAATMLGLTDVPVIRLSHLDEAERRAYAANAVDAFANHVVGDARGLPLAITLSPGQASDKAAVADLLAIHLSPGNVVADLGYDARAVLDIIEAYGEREHTPTQRDLKLQRSVDPALDRQRNLID